MKKSKLFLAFGALTLALVSVFATKASKKFATITTIYFPSLSARVVDPGSAIFSNTNQASNHELYAALYTYSGGVIGVTVLHGLMQTVASQTTHPAYYK